ncbi:uncharacterized protein LOC117928226 [Vitis riparia]|uniref:uncharacterized protein LOC117928226 n=1 Tax=Vitis riparia TaxID=96939 RepID=UPI00155B2CF9|nr:uncharacterized protein LOC117928226 [Vitis riparia]
MAAPIRVSGQTPRPIAGLALSSLPMKTACQLKQNRAMTRQQGISIKSVKKNKTKFRGLCLAVQRRSNSYFGLSGPFPSETIEQFYTCINDKNLKQLAKLVSDDCCFNDLSFPQPFKGKKEVLRFFEELTAVMGKNVKFRILHVCEGDGLTAAIDWHLEWQGKQIPFTRGCSFYECAEEGKSLIIKEAKIVIESPIKPGPFALTLLKIVTTLFDDFPKATERFLKGPDAILEILLKIYKTFLRPFINPLLGLCINLWKFWARLLAFAFNIIHYILKIFFK